MTITYLKAIVALVVPTGLLAGSVSAAGAQVYVDADATGPVHDGSSWCRAFLDLQSGLEAAPPASTVRIADGIYTPDPTGLPDPREATFRLRNLVTVEGGYAGCGASDPDDRDPELYPTLLSGDLTRDDTRGGPVNENAYHLVTSSGTDSTAVLDGVTIRSGYAYTCGGGCEPQELGGGLYNSGGHPLIRRCRFESNFAWRGGAIYSEAGGMSLVDCIFVANECTGEGGAIFDFSDEPDLINCLFIDNQAGSDGGAIFSDLSNVSLVNCTLYRNLSGSRGGGVYNYVGVAMSLTNSIFWGNSDVGGINEEAQIFNNPSNLVDVNYCCVEGWTGVFGGVGNFGDDPVFVLPPGNLRLDPDSPCIDQGDNDAVVVTTDLDGRPRILGGRVDLGPYEYLSPSAVDEPNADGSPIALRVFPNPSRDQVEIRFQSPGPEYGELLILDTAGRRIRSLDLVALGGKGYRSRWDGRDARGRLAGAGIYWVRLNSPGGTPHNQKVVILRENSPTRR